jgi:hypothetical protein
MDRVVGWLVRRGLWALLAIGVAWIGSRAGCTGGDSETISAEAVAKARLGWQLQIDWDGTAVQLPLERMDIYVHEDEEYPEIFEINGPGVTLVGTLPIVVGYDEEFGELVGKTIAFAPSGGDPGNPKYSQVSIDGRAVPVSGGSFTVERVTGKWSGLEGDKTIWGTVQLRIPAAGGDRVVSGKLAVHAITWG